MGTRVSAIDISSSGNMGSPGDSSSTEVATAVATFIYGNSNVKVKKHMAGTQIVSYPRSDTNRNLVAKPIHG